MSGISTVGDPIAPHGCWSGGVISSGSPDVLINGKPAARVGDSGTPHSWICPKSKPPHEVILSSGSSTILINGKPAARIGDSTSCGSVIIAGSANVIAGG